MTSARPPQEVGEFLLARVIKSNSGPIMETVMHGSWSAVMENIKDSSVRNDAIRDAEVKDKKIAALEKQLVRAKARADSAEAEIKRLHSEAVIKPLMQEAVNQLDSLAKRMDTLEETEQQRLLEEDLHYPPGYEPEELSEELADHEEEEEPSHHPSGDLHVIEAKSNGRASRDGDGDGDDEMDVLPKVPLPKPETEIN